MPAKSANAVLEAMPEVKPEPPSYPMDAILGLVPQTRAQTPGTDARHRRKAQTQGTDARHRHKAQTQGTDPRHRPKAQTQGTDTRDRRRAQTQGTGHVELQPRA